MLAWHTEEHALRTALHLLDKAVMLVLVPVEAQLADPLKVIGVGAAHFAQLLNHVPSVHLNGDQRHNLRDSLAVSTSSRAVSIG